jgi:shikimate dehydrogenase
VVLTGETRLVGLIGDPVSHSLSPRMQNAAFAARGLDWAYVPLPVRADDLEAAALGLSTLGFAGANVTTPHKTAILAYCDELDEVAERAGSVNTIVVRNGRLVGSSTDGQAVVESVEASGRSVLVLGAGGAAQAVATALLDAGAAPLTMAARSAERAHALAVRLRTLFSQVEIQAADEWPPRGIDAALVVNATPVRDELLVEVDANQTVVDLAYAADRTMTTFAAAARARGCEVVDGLDVLVAQGAASFERWTGISAPVDVMRAAVRESP